MKFWKIENILVVLIMMAVLIVGVLLFLQNNATSFTEKAAVVLSSKSNVLTLIPPLLPPQKLSNPPEIIKAVYVTGYSAGTKSYLNYLTNLFKTTEINAVVIDIKDYSGLVSYNSGAPDVKKYNLSDGAIKDVDSLVRFFHNQNIYVIGRIVVFEDPAYSKARPELAIYNKTKTTSLTSSDLQPIGPEPSRRILWQDNSGLSWLDPASKDVWDYNISLAKDVFSHGFDEVNFDYVRFPSDGNMENIGFPVWDSKIPKSEVIKEFFQYVRSNLPGEKISVDLFGQTTTNTDDMGIGQVIENAFENFDYVSPMVYPSHYADNFLGFANPADHPYEIIEYAMSTALSREKSFLNQQQDVLTVKNNDLTQTTTPALATTVPAPLVMVPLAKFRPWLQDFNMGAYYTADMVEQEIKATQDALGSEFNGFMLWNPSNIYTTSAVLTPK